jgi:hypothetical protein
LDLILGTFQGSVLHSSETDTVQLWPIVRLCRSRRTFGRATCVVVMCQLDELPCNARFLHALGCCIGDTFAVHQQIFVRVGIHGPQANMMWSAGRVLLQASSARLMYNGDKIPFESSMDPHVFLGLPSSDSLHLHLKSLHIHRNVRKEHLLMIRDPFD